MNRGAEGALELCSSCSSSGNGEMVRGRGLL